MANPLFDLMGTPPIVKQFLEFQKNFTGDPQVQVQQMLNSGRITQADYNAAVQKANELQAILKNLP